MLLWLWLTEQVSLDRERVERQDLEQQLRQKAFSVSELQSKYDAQNTELHARFVLASDDPANMIHTGGVHVHVANSACNLCTGYHSNQEWISWR